jgi:hypothetical protein
MTTLTFPQFDYAQRAQLLAYIKRNKWDFQISESEDEFLYNEMVESEKSGIGDINKVMEFLQA